MGDLYTDIMTSYQNRSLISFDEVAEHFGFQSDTLLRKVQAGEVKLPVFRLDPSSQKSGLRVRVRDFAIYAQHVYNMQVEPQKQEWLMQAA